MGKRKGKRRLPPNVSVYERRNGTTGYRGRFRIGPKQYVTSVVDTPERAYSDVRARRIEAQAAPTQGSPTLGMALDMERKAAVHRGAGRYTLLCHDSVATFLLKGWDSGTPLHELTVESIVAWAVRVRDEGYKGASGAIRHRSTQSLKEKDIPLLARCFRVAGVSSPIPDAVGRLGKSLKAKRKPPKMFSSLEEAGAVIGRIRRYGTPECGRDADILSLVLVTGARAGEMERLMAGDINIPGRTMALDSRKSDSRVLVIPQVAMPIVARLLERADGGPIVPGGMQELKTICTRWKRRLKDPRITCRALRHTFCTFSQEAGVAPSIVKSAMGHTSLRTTTRYTHSRAAAHQAAFDLVGELALGSPQLERKTECLS